jgi:hypothetical protein
VKLIRAYRFRREALKMLGVFFVIFIGGFTAVAGFDWITGKDASPILSAIWFASLLLVALAVLSLLIWLGIRAVEKRGHQNSNKDITLG